MKNLGRKKWFLTLVVLVGLFATAPAVKADPFLLGTVPLAPGGTVVPGLVASGTPPGVFLGALLLPLSGAFSGTLVTAVFREAGGTLDFYYQFSISAGPFFDGLTTTNYTGFATQVGFRTDGASLLAGFFVNGTIFPTLADRNAAGNLVGFSFGLAPIAPPFTSGVLVISTDATTFTTGSITLTGAGGTSTGSGFAPAAAVPEPATVLLLGAGLAGVAARVRKRRKPSRDEEA